MRLVENLHLKAREVGVPELSMGKKKWWVISKAHTVDGSEIRRSPVEAGSLSHYLQGLIHIRWCRISAIHSIADG